MSVFSYMYEERLCRICNGYDVEYRDDHYVLWKTSIRSYAHPHCMVEKFGRKGAMDRVQHRWKLRLFLEALRYPIKKEQEHPLIARNRRGF